MKRLKPLLLIPVLPLVFMACSKSNPGAGPSSGTGGGPSGTNTSSGNTNYVKNLTTVAYGYEGSTTPLDSLVTAYNYDAQNRGTSVTSLDYSITAANPKGVLHTADTTLYTYNAQTIVVTDASTSINGANSSRQTSSSTYFLNKTGTLADSITYSINIMTGLTSFITSTLVYRLGYDANQYLTSMGVYYRTQTGADSLEDQYTYTVSGGNVVNVKDGSTNIITSAGTYSSQTTTTAPLPLPLLVVGGGDGTTGRPNTNLLASTTLTIGPLVYQLGFTYTLDSKGRITRTVQQLSSKLFAVNYYTYY